MSDHDAPDLLTSLQIRERRAKQEMSALELFGQMIHNPDDPQKLYAQFYDVIALILPFDAGYVAMLLPDRAHLRTVYEIDKGIVYEQPDPWVFNPHGPIAVVINQAEPVVMDDLEVELPARFPQVDWTATLFGDVSEVSHGWMMVPMMIQQQVIGTVNIQSYQFGVYDQQSARFLTTLASMLAMGLAQTELVQRLTTVRNALSVPIIPLSDRVIFLPLLGQLDTERIQLIQNLLLQTVQGSRIRFVVFSFIALRTMYPEQLKALDRMIRALQLLGTQAILAGIPPELSLEFVQAGIDFSTLKVVPNLQYVVEHMTIL